MRKTRKQWRGIVEWAVAAGFLAGLFALGLNLLGEIRRVAPVAQVIAREPDAPLPPSFVPSRAVSVPVLALGRNVRIQVGEFATDVMARLQGLAVPPEPMLSIADPTAIERRMSLATQVAAFIS